MNPDGGETMKEFLFLEEEQANPRGAEELREEGNPSPALSEGGTDPSDPSWKPLTSTQLPAGRGVTMDLMQRQVNESWRATVEQREQRRGLPGRGTEPRPFAGEGPQDYEDEMPQQGTSVFPTGLSGRSQMPGKGEFRVKFNGDPKQLSYFITNVRHFMEDFGDQFPSESAKIHTVGANLKEAAADWLMQMYDTGARELACLEDFLRASKTLWQRRGRKPNSKGYTREEGRCQNTPWNLKPQRGRLGTGPTPPNWNISGLVYALRCSSGLYTEEIQETWRTGFCWRGAWRWTNSKSLVVQGRATESNPRQQQHGASPLVAEGRPAGRGEQGGGPASLAAARDIERQSVRKGHSDKRREASQPEATPPELQTSKRESCHGNGNGFSPRAASGRRDGGSGGPGVTGKRLASVLNARRQIEPPEGDGGELRRVNCDIVRVRVRLLNPETGIQVEADAMLDCGCTRCLITPELANRLGVEPNPLKTPVVFAQLDGTPAYGVPVTEKNRVFKNDYGFSC
ncbi:uncharacterized protein LOC134294107 [Anolis carolinensis]|uniref:uncharacterized protein LOC134294107 n=1 Tax=Anolis carolinensis TaxID=28377 RepID=UPI002F2B181A